MHPETRSLTVCLVSIWSIFLDPMEYANQMQELTERSVSDHASEFTHSNKRAQ